LAARPDAVLESVRAQLPPVTADLAAAMRAGATTFEQAGGPDAYFGAPARATRAEGEDLYAILVEMTLCALAETWPELAPRLT
jgi:creatinine amidohydrolase